VSTELAVRVLSGETVNGNRDLEGFRLSENEEPFADFISWLLAVLVEVFLKNRQMHFKLVDLVAVVVPTLHD